MMSSTRGPRRPASVPLAFAAIACLLALGLATAGCGSDRASRLAEAQALQDAGDFSGSIELLRQIVREDPDDAEANHLLGVAYVYTRQPSLAVWPLRKAMESQEYVVPSGVLLATTLLSTGSHEEAAKIADRVIEANPENVAALHARARAHFEAKRFEDALRDADRILTVDPEEFNALLLRGTALARLERKDEAEQAYEHLREVTAKGQDPMLAARGCLGIAMFYDAHVDAEHAEPAFRRCGDAHPGDAIVVRQASAFFDKLDRPEEGDGFWKRAIEERPDDVGLRTAFAARLERRDEYEAARRVLGEAAETFGTAEAWYALAVFENRREDPAAARAAAERALALAEKAGADADEVRFLLADLLVKLDEVEQAEELAASIGDPTFKMLARGQVLLAQGEPEAARRLLAQGIAQWPNNAGARMVAARAAEAAGDLAEAIEQYREAVRADPEGTDAAAAAARIYFETGRYEEAIYFANLQVQKRPFNGPQPYAILARANVALGRPDRARRALDILAEKPGQAMHAAVERAAVERSVDGPAAAIRTLESAGLDLTDPGNEPALRALVENLAAEGRLDAALARLDAALSAQPQLAELHDLRGRVLLAAGRPGPAREAFERALELDPQQGGAKAGLAALAVAEGDAARAIELFDQAAADDPEDPEPAYRAAQLVLRAGRRDEALARLREVTRRHPGSAGAANDLAFLLAERGEDLDLALTLAQRASQIAPAPETFDTLGWVRLKRGDAQEAAAAFERAVEGRPEAPLFRYHLGLALAETGETERAVENLRAALEGEAFPDAEAARAALARLTGSGEAKP